MQVTSSSSRAGRRCPTCHDDLPERSATIDCPSCRAGHHPACWSEGDGCATCGAALRDGADPHDGFDILHLRRRSSDAAPPTTAPLPDRLLVEDDPRALTVRLPMPGTCLQAGFLGVWMCGWVAGEAAALHALFAGGAPADDRAFLAFWTAFWTVGGVAAARTFVASLGGGWRLRLTRDALVIDQGTVLGLPLGRRLRVAPADMRAVHATGSGLVVDHAQGDFTWTEPTTDEARRIADLLRARLDPSKA